MFSSSSGKFAKLERQERCLINFFSCNAIETMLNFVKNGGAAALQYPSVSGLLMFRVICMTICHDQLSAKLDPHTMINEIIKIKVSILSNISFLQLRFVRTADAHICIHLGAPKPNQ